MPPPCPWSLRPLTIVTRALLRAADAAFPILSQLIPLTLGQREGRVQPLDLHSQKPLPPRFPAGAHHTRLRVGDSEVLLKLDRFISAKEVP